MHRIAATPGGWTPDAEGVIFLEQTPASIILITAADTDIQTLAAAVPQLPDTFPSLRVANLLQLQQQLSIDTYADDILSKADVIILRLLGGRSYWSYGLEVVKDIAAENNTALFVLPGDDKPDPDLISHSTVSLSQVNQLWQYFTQGGVTNWVNACQYIAATCLQYPYHPHPPQTVPRLGTYYTPQTPHLPQVGILFYRSHYLAGNTKPIDALCNALKDRNLEAKAIFISSLRDEELHPDLLNHFADSHVLLNTTSFSLAKVGEEEKLNLWTQLNLPVLQVILSGGTQDSWESSYQGLSPRDVAMNVALPEVDGRIITRAVSFKSVATWNENLETDVVIYEPQPDRINIVADMANHWVRLRTTPRKDRKIALILANYPNKDGRLANGVGLDTPASCINILHALQQAGYTLTTYPETGDELMQQLTQGVTNDSEMQEMRPVYQSLPVSEFWDYFHTLPPSLQQSILDRYSQLDEKIKQRPLISLTCKQLQQIVQSLPSSLYSLLTNPNSLFDEKFDEKINRQVEYTITPQEILTLVQSLPSSLYSLLTNPNSLFDEKINRQVEYTITPQEILTLVQSLPNNIQTLLTNPNSLFDEKINRQVEYTITPQEILTLVQSLPNNIQTLLTNPNSLFDEKINRQTPIPIPGLQLDNIFIGIQPSRGYDLDPTLNYHSPDLDPTPNYLAYYYWLREKFAAHAIIHIGKHGNLEWLPGKSLALSKTCYPEISLDTLPHLYPFIVNDPGEGSQAKRRSHAVILDHLTPPLTRAELYGGLQQLETLIDEYYEAQTLDPTRLPIIAEKITQLVQQENLDQDLGIDGSVVTEISQFLTLADGYLCELKDAQIRDGLHIFGECPQGEQLRDLIIAISRNSGYNKIGLIKALAQDLQIEFDETAEYSQPLACPKLNCTNIGDAKNYLETQAQRLVEEILENREQGTRNREQGNTQTTNQLNWIQKTLLPNLQKTPQELTHLIKALDGQYIPSGSSGAPTRGRPDVLPTGRNFYSVDIRSLPTETAWDIGRKAAETVIERYTQENGEYPKTLALSVWGTATMRTGGDDIAEVLALLGVQPVWDGISRRVVDFEILPLSILGRPRVDVTLRISGFFRDSFPNLISLIHSAIDAVAQLNEPPDQNPLAHQVQQDQHHWQAQGLPPETAHNRALERIFGSKPGAYGAGLQGLIEAQNWTSDDDLARAYINWSSYAYTPSENGGLRGISSPEAFQQRLQHLQIVLHNQDNREHDLLDSDDYYQFQGGLTAAVRSISGHNPTTYFGDNSRPSNPKVRHLTEEISRVYRSRVVNPKWIKGVMRHGYKGAFEMAATVDYLFAYDATANCVSDFMYEGVANAYLLDETVQNFIREKNPWALRDMGERLLEAHQRGLWQNANIDQLEELRALVNSAEGTIEMSASSD